MVAAKRDYLGEFQGGGQRSPVSKFQVSGGHLRQGDGVVEGSYRDVAAVEDRGPG